MEATVKLLDLNVLTPTSQPITVANLGQPVLFAVDLANNALVKQQYTYILQIKDQNGFVVSLSWVIDFVNVRQLTKSSIAWVPLDRGAYTAEAFVWKGIDDPVPLSFSTQVKTLTAE